jgi:hypothetical protein
MARKQHMKRVPHHSPSHSNSWTLAGFAAVLAPIGWFFSLLVSYVLVPHVCISGASWLLPMIMVVALVLVAGTGGCSWRAWRATGHERPEEAGGAIPPFSATLWYPRYQATSAAWGLNLLEDQQLGGLIMWVPAGGVYLMIGLMLMADWFVAVEERSRTLQVLSPALRADREQGGERSRNAADFP